MTGLAGWLFGIAMVVGLVGVLVPVIPGLALIVGAAILWAFEVGTWQAWVLVAVMTAVCGLGTVVKYQVPGRELASMNLSTRSWLLAVVGGVVGFFVIPLVGLVVGFVLGVYLGQRAELGSHAPAWARTKRVLGGVGKGIAIEFAAGFVAVTAWFAAVVFWI